MDEVRKQFIINCVKKYIKETPQEYEEICKSVKLERTKKNKFASDGKQDFMRWGTRVPEGLFYVLDRALKNPRFLDGDELHWWMKNFPQFRIPETV